MSGAVEYDCCECGARVWRAIGPVPDPPLCALCLFLPGYRQDDTGKIVPINWEDEHEDH